MKHWAIEPPDEIMPEQWFVPTSAATEQPGEYRLMLDILVSAIEDITNDCRTKHAAKAREGAACWIFMEPSGAPVEFRQACEFVGIDTEWLRAKIEQLVERKRAR